jgi:hypothetical protein
VGVGDALYVAERAAGQVRRPKWLWWIASTTLTGSLAYWMFARKDAD